MREQEMQMSLLGASAEGAGSEGGGEGSGNRPDGSRRPTRRARHCGLAGVVLGYATTESLDPV